MGDPNDFPFGRFSLNKDEIKKSIIKIDRTEERNHGENLYITLVNLLARHHTMSMTEFGYLFSYELNNMKRNLSQTDETENLIGSFTIATELLRATFKPQFQMVNEKIKVIIMYCFFNWLNEGSISYDIRNSNESIKNRFKTLKSDIQLRLHTYTGMDLVPRLDDLREENKKMPPNERNFDTNASLSLLQTMDRLTDILAIKDASVFTPHIQ